MCKSANWGICRVCDKPIETGQEWLALNRYMVGTGHARGMAEARNDDDEYEWCMSDDIEEEIASAAALHWPICATMWIDGKIADVNATFPRNA